MKNQKGFSLINIIIAAAMLGGLSLVVVNLMQQGQRAVKTTEIGMEALDFKAILVDMLKDRDICTMTLGKVTGPPDREGLAPGAANILTTNTIGADQGIFDANGNIRWQAGDLVSGGYKLISMEIPDQVLDVNTSTMVQNYYSTNASTNSGDMQIFVRLEKTNEKQTSGTKDKLLKLRISANVYNDTGINGDPANDYRIASCQLTGSSTGPAPNAFTVQLITGLSDLINDKSYLDSASMTPAPHSVAVDGVDTNWASIFPITAPATANLTAIEIKGTLANWASDAKHEHTFMANYFIKWDSNQMTGTYIIIVGLGNWASTGSFDHPLDGNDASAVVKGGVPGIVDPFYNTPPISNIDGTTRSINKLAVSEGFDNFSIVIKHY